MEAKMINYKEIKLKKFKEKISHVPPIDKLVLNQTPIWFCGVEPGDTETSESIRLWLEGNSVNPPRLFSDEFKNKHPKWRRWPVDGKISTIMTSYLFDGDISKRRQYRDEKLYMDNVCYKINLYPLCFPNINVDDCKYLDIWNQIGVASKDEYYKVCQEVLFPLPRKLYSNIKSPRIVVCFGSMNRSDFLDAFPPIDPIIIKAYPEIEAEVYRSAGNITVILRPHLIARKQCNYLEGLQKFGEFLKQHNI